MTGTFMVIEVVGGLFTGSLALLADAGHMLTDVAALGLSAFAMWMAARPSTPEKSYGYHRAEILAAVTNADVTHRTRWPRRECRQHEAAR